jgi:hypothetical protein
VAWLATFYVCACGGCLPSTETEIETSIISVSNNGSDSSFKTCSSSSFLLTS